MNLQGLEIEIIKKKVKNLNLRVYPDGRIRLSAPLKLPDHEIHSFLLSKIQWIKKQKARFPKKLEYVSGETHYFMGNKYKLDVIPTADSPRVEINQEHIALYAKPESDNEQILYEFYHSELKKQIPLFIKKWESSIGKRVSGFKIRRMKTRWGSCNINKKRISLNLELAKRPQHCLDYVVLHEMVHLIEKSHNKNFKSMMTLFLPEWRIYKKELKNIVL